MPYYLVTQTSLVEGDDEAKVAQKVLAKLRSDIAVEFTVKFDEENIRQVTVTDAVPLEAAPPITINPRSSIEAIPQEFLPEALLTHRLEKGALEPRGLPNKGITLGINLFVAGVAVGLLLNHLH
jgi:hypothetical protein